MMDDFYDGMTTEQFVHVQESLAQRGTGRWNRNHPVWHDGIKFRSTVEGDVYLELRLLEQAGKIQQLVPNPENPKQPKFLLLPKGKCPHTGETIRSHRYIADFMYWDVERQQTVVVDVKGKTKDKHGNIIPLTDTVFRLKWDWVRSLYPQYLFEIVMRGK